MSQVKRIAIIGLGSIGRRHLRVLHKLRPDIEVLLVRSGKGAPCSEEALAMGSVSSLDEAIDAGIDAAIISSPAPNHVEQAQKLASVGKHIFVEKPLSVTYEEASPLVGSLKSSEGKALIGYVLRYSPAANHFRKAIAEYKLGKLLFAAIECGSYLPDWRPDQDYRVTASAARATGGGVLLELSHEIDYANWFFGPFTCVQASLHNSGTLDVDVEDIAHLTLLTHSGFPVFINLDFCRRVSHRSCTLHGAEGTLSWDALAHSVTLSAPSGDTHVSSFDVERDDLYKAQLLHFLTCIEGGEAPQVSLDDGLSTLKIIDAARQSAMSGRVVTL